MNKYNKCTVEEEKKWVSLNFEIIRKKEKTEHNTLFLSSRCLKMLKNQDFCFKWKLVIY